MDVGRCGVTPGLRWLVLAVATALDLDGVNPMSARSVDVRFDGEDGFYAKVELLGTSAWWSTAERVAERVGNRPAEQLAAFS